jgi:membrane-associated phospholipid phosphatase
MHRLALPAALLAVAAHAARAQPAAAQAPYRVSWWDAAAVATAGALAVIPTAAGLPHGPPPCAPCRATSLPGIDHAALHTFSGPARTASSVLLVSVAGFAALASLDGASAAQARGHAVVFANSLAWTYAATEWLKVLAHRSRPVLYTAQAPAAASQRDNRRSFPSGHAAVAFAAATSYAVIAQRERLPHRTRNAALLYGGALGVAVLRVAGGKHFPTDVAGGAALGAGIGWLTARVHPTAR